MLLFRQGPWGAWREPLSWTAGVSLSRSVPLEQECPRPMVGVSPGLSLGWGAVKMTPEAGSAVAALLGVSA